MESLANPLRRPRPEPGCDRKNATASKARLWRWVPIRALQARHRHRIEQHLLGLSASDRYLRFGYPANDERIHAYVQSLDFTRDEVFGIFNRRLKLVAMAHLAYADMPGMDLQPQEHMAEFAVSVLPQARGRRYGARLFDHAVMHARNRRIARLLIHALSENTAMLRIARNAGAAVQRDGSESDAWLAVPPETIGSHVEELISTHAAELNYGLRFRSRQVARALAALQTLRRRWTQPHKANTP
ncbi:MAG: N-acetyltransferase family protein [Leptothrix sp. (in: b-proteobacteria)]